MSGPGRRDSRSRLIEAALVVLGQRGYRGATTRDIAAQAGLSEMTLFRHFPTKQELAEAALAEATAPFRAGTGQLTDDLHADLVRLAAGYVAFIDRWPALVDRVLPELADDEEFGSGAGELLGRNAARVLALVAHHREAGRLAGGSDADTARGFLGPLLARASLRRVLPVEPLDVDGYVTRFLDGHRSR